MNIKCGWWDSPTVQQLNWSDAYFLVALISIVDRNGAYIDSAYAIGYDAFESQMMEDEQATVKRIAMALDSLCDRTDPPVIRYEAGGHKYILVRNFLKHNKLDYVPVRHELPQPIVDMLRADGLSPCTREDSSIDLRDNDIVKRAPTRRVPRLNGKKGPRATVPAARQPVR